MKTIFEIIRRQWIGMLALVVAVGGTAVAATDVLTLGTGNVAGRTTGLRNTGSGAALSLQVATGQPPLAVNSRALVPRFNAALLQGRAPKDFAPASGSQNYVAAGSVYTKQQSDARYAPASGSPVYATVGSAYTKVESDARYAPAAGSTAYAAADSVYSKPVADARYAPAAYVAGPQVLAAGPLSTDAGFSATVTAPAAGTIFVVASGTRTVGSTKTATLTVAAGTGAGSSATFGEAFGSAGGTIGCTVADYEAVAAGQTLAASAAWSPAAPEAQFSGVVTVLFQPSP